MLKLSCINKITIGLSLSKLCQHVVREEIHINRSSKFWNGWRSN